MAVTWRNLFNVRIETIVVGKCNFLFSFDQSNLKGKCIEFIVNDTGNALKLKAFLQCDKDVLMEKLGLEYMSCKEHIVFDGVHWMGQR